MKTSSPPKRAITPIAFRESAGVVGWALGAYAVVQFLGRMFSQNVVGAVAVETLAAELMAGKAGVAWSNASAPPQSEKEIALRAARGAAFGVAAAALAFGVLAARASLTAGRLSFASAAFGLLTASLVAVRDELLLRGFVIRAFRNVLPVPVLLAVCGLAAAAARMSDPAATPIEITSSAALGVAFAAAWIRDRGAWMACGAHAAWLWTTTTLGRGVLFDMKSSAGSLEGDLFVMGTLAAVALACARFAASRESGVRIRGGEGMNGANHE